ncbi:MAG: hypothetical protein LBN36_03225 [Clostridiales Family XIII bacterium]|jgi:Na+/H+ antiporter NhaC|nr:hypothetical protein [Clostridiales Family XIII bacterium]
MEESLNLGIISLLPIVVLFVLIFITKRMLLSLTAASLVGAVLIGRASFASVWLLKVQEAFMEGTIGYLILLLALFGILIALLDYSGAVFEFANWLAKYANTRRKALIITYILGWLIFVDDYLNNLAVSTAMKKLCDKHGIPRTMLGYVVNSTAAPVCILIPISTWAVFYSGLFEEFGVVRNGSGMSAYIAGIPFLFYGWISLVVCLLLVLGVLPMIGLIKKDNQLAKETGVVCSVERNLDGAEITTTNSQNAEGEVLKKNPIKFILPLLLLIGLTVLTGDVLIGCMGAIVVVGAIMVFDKRFNLGDIFDNAYKGVASMASITCVITMALTLVGINTSTGLPDFVVATLTPILNSAVLPAIVFGFCAVYSYFGGGFWDMSLLFMPIVVPLAIALNLDPLMSCAALVCAATAGSTTYVAGDAIMITSRAVDIKPFYQMLATLPYAIISYVLSVIAFVIAGFVI